MAVFEIILNVDSRNLPARDIGAWLLNLSAVHNVISALTSEADSDTLSARTLRDFVSHAIETGIPFSSGYYLREFAHESVNPDIYVSSKCRTAANQILFELDNVVQEAALVKLPGLRVSALTARLDDNSFKIASYSDDVGLGELFGRILRKFMEGFHKFTHARGRNEQSEALREFWEQQRREAAERRQASVEPLVISFLALYDVYLALNGSDLQLRFE
jgi:hypothetical protein